MLAFVAAALVLIMIPGPDQALITRNALAHGRTAGLTTMVGGSLGLSVHAGAAALGVSSLLLASAVAFTLLKMIGTVYLVWMGVHTLLSARRTAREQESNDPPQPYGAGPRYLRHGFLSNSLNPKVALFFVTFLPQFLPIDGGALSYALLLSVVFALLYLAWFSLYVLTVDWFGAVLRRPQVRARIEQVTGTILIGFGVRLALQQPWDG